jgi:hypothetical protein
MAATATATRPARRTARPKKAPVWKSRAVYRLIEAGSAVSCVTCGEHIKFKAKIRAKQVICNVYTKGVWQRVEHFHEECYVKAGEPYGVAAD